jgi:hypothetical protein
VVRLSVESPTAARRRREYERYVARRTPALPREPRRLTEVDAMKLERVVVRTALQSARAMGDAERADSHERELREMDARIDEKEATVNHEAGHEEIVADWKRKVGASLAELRRLEAEADRLPPDYVERERARIAREADHSDSATLANLRAWAETALGHAAREREAGDAERDPSERVADEMLTRRLSDGVKSRRQADELLAEARRLVSLGQARKAAAYVEAARPHSPFGLGQVAADVERALDSAVPGRRRARAIERTVERSRREFEVYRRLALAEAGLGVRSDGAVGRGTPHDIAVATGSAKDMLYTLDRDASAGE